MIDNPFNNSQMLENQTDTFEKQNQNGSFEKQIGSFEKATGSFENALKQTETLVENKESKDLINSNTSISTISLYNIPFTMVRESNGANQKGANQKGVIFVDLQSMRNLETESDYQSILDNINNFLREFNSINQKGYINEKEPATFLLPVVKDFVIGFDLMDMPNDEATYKWWCNLIFFNLYAICVQTELDLKDQSKYLDKISDFDNLGRRIYTLLDPSIRSIIQKRGISIIQNVYTAFDTEYHLLDESKQLNHLLSVQLASNTRLLVRLPAYNDFKMSYVHPLNSMVFPKHESPKLKIVESSINRCVKFIRNLKFKDNDKIIGIIIKSLRENRDLKFFLDKEKECYVFAFPHTKTNSFVYFNDSNAGYSFKEMVLQSDTLSEKSLRDSYLSFITFLKDFFLKELDKELVKSSEASSTLSDSSGHKVKTENLIKPLTRTTYQYAGDKISVSRLKNNYFICHNSSADLSMLNDFEDLKDELNIVSKSFVTIGKPLRIHGSNVHIRDTMLLAPAGNRSLASIGKLYGEEFNKIELTIEEKQNMHLLLKRDKIRFEEYAKLDAVITLKHSNAMEDFNFTLNKIGVPLTLSSLGKDYVLKQWATRGLKGYQMSKRYLLGDSSILQTPKGLNVTKDIGLYLSLFIANYKGGRNESFMYGVDTNTHWYDYDLTSAYTTAMAHLGDPDYEEISVNQASEISIDDWTHDLFLDNYVIVKGSFEFPSNVKYPSIPCFVDEVITVYPLKGSCILTGPEYLVALNQGAEFSLDTVLIIPFSRNLENEIIDRPFQSIIKEIQTKRREYPKGHILNLLHKEMGNSIYGNLVRGMSNKKRFDIKSGTNLRMDASPLSNPILASYTTAFIRSVLGECLHNIEELGGKVVSATTDGFITDIVDLEDKLLTLDQNKTPLLRKYREIRKILSDDASALELKHSGKGIISWTTRGQLGIESSIKATTGFQAWGYDKKQLVDIFIDLMKSDSKFFEFTASSLRGANEIYKKGGHVTMTYKDQTYRLFFDNRRRIIEPDDFNDNFDLSSNLLDSEPLWDTTECGKLRFLGSFHRNALFNRITSKSRGTKYKNTLEIAVRSFIKALFSKEPMFGLEEHKDIFNSYKEIIEFIHSHEPCKRISLTPQSISNLKQRKILIKPVPRTPETEAFVEYVKTKLVNFKDQNFFK